MKKDIHYNLLSIELFIAFFCEVVVPTALIPWCLTESLANFKTTKASYLPDEE